MTERYLLCRASVVRFVSQRLRWSGCSVDILRERDWVSVVVENHRWLLFER